MIPGFRAHDLLRGVFRWVVTRRVPIRLIQGLYGEPRGIQAM